MDKITLKDILLAKNEYIAGGSGGIPTNLTNFKRDYRDVLTLLNGQRNISWSKYPHFSYDHPYRYDDSNAEKFKELILQILLYKNDVKVIKSSPYSCFYKY